VEQYTENLYDDDLTVDVDEYDDFVQTDDIDLFEFYGEEESSISRLKTIVLSIDWEITDENLQDFNDELLVLKEEQREDKVNLVYIQALEKIGKYIAKEKSNSNHNAVKLLQTFFYTLEKNISSGTVTDEERKKALAEDVKKFEKLKDQISGSTRSKKKEKLPPAAAPAVEKTVQVKKVVPEPSPLVKDDESPIRKLKAIILGMDWEITDKDLNALGQEVKHLQDVYAGAKPKLIFLQGIDSIGAYIKKKKSNSHADAFKLLHSFCEKLDLITSTPLSLQEEKTILLPEVEKFNRFKEVVINTIDSEDNTAEREEEHESYDELPPAFADVGDDVRGFQVDEESAGLQDAELAVGDKIGSFFDDDSGEPVEAPPLVDDKSKTLETINTFFDETPIEESAESVDETVALQGVNVETEADDDSEEEPLPFTSSGELAPALSGGDILGEADAEDGEWQDTREASEVFAKLDGFFGEDEVLAAEPEKMVEAPVEALAGVDVETEADDESDEAPLPVWDSGDVAPALSGFDDEEDELVIEADLEAGVEKSFDNIFGEDENFDTFKDADEEDLSPASVDEEENIFALTEEDEEAFTVALDDTDTNVEEELADELSSEVDAFFDDTLAAEDFVPALDEAALESTEDSFEDVDRMVEVAEDVQGLAFDDETVEPEEEVVFELADDQSEEDLLEDALSVSSASTVDEDKFDAVFEQADDDLLESPVEEALTTETEIAIKEEDEEDDLTFDIQDDESALDVDVEDETAEIAFTEEDIVDDAEELLEESAVTEDDSFIAALADVKEDALDESIFEEPVEEVKIDLSAKTPEDSEEDFLQEYEEDLEAYFKSTGLDSETDILANLRAGVSSIGVELDDSIINALFAEVQEVGKKYNDKPIGKVMLQLMSTVIQHINQYRYEASSDAHSLLLSIFDKLEMIDRGDVDGKAAQEMLLEETTKILTWQQTMLDRQAVVKGDVLTFMDPIRSETGAEKAGEFVFTKLDIIDEGDLVEEDPFGFDEDKSEKNDSTENRLAEDNAVISDDSAVTQEEAPSENITVLIKEEMKALRASFQEEINNLRKELENRK